MPLRERELEGDRPPPVDLDVGVQRLADPPQRVLDSEAMRYSRATDDYVEEETRRELQAIGERRTLVFRRTSSWGARGCITTELFPTR